VLGSGLLVVLLRLCRKQLRGNLRPQTSAHGGNDRKMLPTNMGEAVTILNNESEGYDT
jgi:hypothetical protein